MNFLAAASFLSMDSFLASLALGASPFSIAFGNNRNLQIRTALAFGVCDGVASLLRALVNTPVWITHSGVPWVFLCYLVFGFTSLFTLKCRRPAAWLVWTLALIFSLDNLTGPQAAKPFIACILPVAIFSSAMSFLGFRLAAHAVSALRQMQILCQKRLLLETGR